MNIDCIIIQNYQENIFTEVSAFGNHNGKYTQYKRGCKIVRKCKTYKKPAYVFLSLLPCCNSRRLMEIEHDVTLSSVNTSNTS